MGCNRAVAGGGYIELLTFSCQKVTKDKAKQNFLALLTILRTAFEVVPLWRET
jgi:hypothetical protein